MTTRTLTAMFNSRAEAERAAQQLAGQLGMERAMVRISPEAGASDASQEAARPHRETGFFASLRDLFLPEEDRHAYAEGMRRGGMLVSVQVGLDQVDQAADILEEAGAVDLDQQETDWRESGWTGRDAGAPVAAAPLAARAAAAPGGDEVIPVAEERLVVGKREVDRGRVRVRSYVAERPAEAQVRLHQEHVAVERRPANQALTEADRAAAFRDRTIEATAISEEAVVGKEARVVEEITIRKEAAERVEAVRDTVRKTEVEIEDATMGSPGASTGQGSAAARAPGPEPTWTR